MAASVRESTGLDDDLDVAHEINVTPFIDVILVLLIIFMVAAPLATVDINVDLPTSTAQPEPRPDKPLYVTLKDDLSIAVGEHAVSEAELGRAIDRATGGDRQARIFVRADRVVEYGELMGLMNALRAAGYLKIGLVGLEGAVAPPAAATGG
jgi:biopolymer transport protein ExbD